MKITFSILIIIFLTIGNIYAQNKTPEDFGFRHLTTIYQKDTIHILILSKKGEELKTKPVLLFIQGSLPIPLIVVENNEPYGTFPFNTDSLLQYYHLAIISKPYIPIICEKKYLQANFSYVDSSTKTFPVKYIERNLLNYYVYRNTHVIKFLKQQPFVKKNKFIIAGHSEGAAIAAKLALISKDVTNLIYLNGNPLGRIMSIIAQARVQQEKSNEEVEKIFNNWQNIIKKPNDISQKIGDTYKTTFDFSIPPPIDYLEKITVPVLIVYSTKDESVVCNDYLRVDMMRKQKNNFTFKTYFQLNHNFFGFKPNGEIDYNNFNWDQVALDWLSWLQNH